MNCKKKSCHCRLFCKSQKSHPFKIMCLKILTAYDKPYETSKIFLLNFLKILKNVGVFTIINVSLMGFYITPCPDNLK